MTESYTLGEYLDGHTNYGEDALMSADKFADRFQHICFGFGYREAEIIPQKHEIKRMVPGAPGQIRKQVQIMKKRKQKQYKMTKKDWMELLNFWPMTIVVPSC